MSSSPDLHTLLGDDADALLGYTAKAFPRENLVLPGPDYLSMPETRSGGRARQGKARQGKKRRQGKAMSDKVGGVRSAEDRTVNGTGDSGAPWTITT